MVKIQIIHGKEDMVKLKRQRIICNSFFHLHNCFLPNRFFMTICFLSKFKYSKNDRTNLICWPLLVCFVSAKLMSELDFKETKMAELFTRLKNWQKSNTAYKQLLCKKYKLINIKILYVYCLSVQCLYVNHLTKFTSDSEDKLF